MNQLIELSEAALRRNLRREVRKGGGLMAWCKAHRMAHGNVSRMMKGKKLIGPKVHAALGLRRVAAFRQLNP